jgi:hypothetical protein
MHQDDLTIKVDTADVKPQLPFEDGQQQALLGHIMTQEPFFRQTYRKVQPEWFTDAYVAKVYKFYCEFYGAYDRVPLTSKEFKQWESFLAQDQAERNKLYSKLDLCLTQINNYGMDYLSDQLTAWQKTQIFLKDLPQIANLINSRQIAKAEQLYQNSAKELIFSKFGGNGIIKWSDYKIYRDTVETETDGAISTGLPVLDRHILPDCKDGALLPGDTTVVLAPVNLGKTSVLITIAKHAFVTGKSILFIVREGRETDIVTKFYRSVFGKTSGEFWPWTRTPEGEAGIAQVSKWMDDRLHVIHMPKVTLYVEDVVADIYRLQAARRAQTGKGYDLLVMDYPGILQAQEAKGARWEFRQTQDYIYRQFVQLGLEERFHVLLAAQTNREGSKINKGLAAKRLLSSEDIAESFGIVQSATNIITLNRDDKAAAGSYITFFLVKSRSSETGWAITAKSNYACAITHSEELGGVGYRGNASISDQVESLIQNYKNKDLPAGLVDGFKVNKNNGH